MLLASTIVSGLIQLALGDPPDSVQDTAPEWFGYAFILIQTLAGLLALASLYVEDGSSRNPARLHASLSMERVGLIGVLTVIIVNVAAVMFYSDGPPAAPATWFGITFGVWLGVFRLPEIGRALRELTR